jgi:hypothetical protein
MLGLKPEDEAKKQEVKKACFHKVYGVECLVLKRLVIV